MTRYTAHFYRPKMDGTEQERRIQLGKLLRNARKAAEFTQAEVAPKLGYKHQSHISQIENGNRTLDPIELENFARMYGKTLNDFATLRDDKPTTEELPRRAKEFARRAVATSKSKPKGKRRSATRIPSAEETAGLEKLRRSLEAKALKETGEKSEP
jgi:transcriptional regulator with XRE-family HTH domain